MHLTNNWNHLVYDNPLPSLIDWMLPPPMPVLKADDSLSPQLAVFIPPKNPTEKANWIAIGVF